MKYITLLLSGIIFGVGLILSVQKQKKPIFNESFDLPKSKDLDFRLIFGAG